MTAHGYPRVPLPNRTRTPDYAADAATITRRLGPGPTARRLTAELRRRQTTFVQAAAAAGMGTARAQEARTALELSDAASHLLLAPTQDRADLALKLTVLIAAGEASADDALAFPWLYLRALHADLSDKSHVGGTPQPLPGSSYFGDLRGLQSCRFRTARRPRMTQRDIIVIGGSSGATVPLRVILGALPQDLPAAIFVVLHIPSRSLGLLATVTAAAASLPVHAAEDGMSISPGNVYLGVPDHHLIVAGGHIRLGRGPRENMARPSIDPLFRSAAISYGPRVIGVLLSGLLSDGAAGLEAIKRCGGLTLVQDPADAIADEMPRSALQSLEVDLTLSAARIGDVLADLVRDPAGPALPIPPEIRLEVDIAAGARVDSDVIRRVADPAALSCPQCGGVLSMMRDTKPLRFRCQVGHAFTAEAVAKEQEGAIDEALRVALRIIEERAELVRRMATDGRQAGRRALAEMYEERAAEYSEYAETIRKAVLRSLSPPEPSGDEGAQED